MQIGRRGVHLGHDTCNLPIEVLDCRRDQAFDVKCLAFLGGIGRALVQSRIVNHVIRWAIVHRDRSLPVT